MNIKDVLLGPTVSDFAQQWRVMPAHGDVARYQLISVIRCYIEPYWRDKRIKLVKRKDVDNYVNLIKQLKNRRTGEPLSDALIHSILKNNKAMLGYAVSLGLLKANPMSHVKLKAIQYRVEFYNKQQVQTLLNANYPPGPYKLAVCLGVCAGLRRGEVVALCWDDVDLEQRCLHIRHSANMILGELIIKSPKSGKERTVPISNKLHKMLRDARKTATSSRVVPLNPWQITIWLPTFAESLGLPKYHYHCLRKTFGTLLLHSGVDIKTVSVLMGHSSIQTTAQSYIGYDARQGAVAVNKMV